MAAEPVSPLNPIYELEDGEDFSLYLRNIKFLFLHSATTTLEHKFSLLAEINQSANDESKISEVFIEIGPKKSDITRINRAAFEITEATVDFSNTRGFQIWTNSENLLIQPVEDPREPQDTSIPQDSILDEEDNYNYRLYPNGDNTFKRFIPGKFSSKIPMFSFSKEERPKLETARELEED